MSWEDDIRSAVERDNTWWLLWHFHWTQLVLSAPYDSDDLYEELGGEA